MSRATVIIFGILLVVGFLSYSFWPRAIIVDIGTVTRGSMAVTIDEEAKTRVRDAYTVSAPFSGRLLRIESEPGDKVIQHETVIARLLPANPTVLDVRTEEQAKAAVEAAMAALVLAQAEVKKAAADADYAKLEIDRTRKLRASDVVSEVALDRAERSWRAASANVETAHAAVAMRQADVSQAQSMLMTFSEAQKIALAINPHPKDSVPINAPISGCVLRVLQESETIINAGAPILEIGNPSEDLEILAELLSTDAVKISSGNRVIIEKWGGDEPLEGFVEKVEPWGFTKFSALGVEEQRVNAIVKFSGSADAHQKLGHGFRVEVKIIIWENENALKAPSSAIFRNGDDWAVFKVENGRARLTTIKIGHNNGLDIEIVEGISKDDQIVLYPGNQISDGALIKERTLTN